MSGSRPMGMLNTGKQLWPPGKWLNHWLFRFSLVIIVGFEPTSSFFDPTPVIR